MEFDIIVVGSGIAGLSAAIKASSFCKVAIVTKSSLEDSNTVWAQGGLAASFGQDDNAQLHYYDTLRAGDGLCNKKAVRILVNSVKDEILWLTSQHVPFTMKDGRYALSREAVHSRPRIVHHKDHTGLTIEQQLITNVKLNPSITIFGEL